MEEGIQGALNEKHRSGQPPKFTGREKAKLILIACSDPPEGRSRWGVRLLADKLVELKIVDSISRETVRKSKKGELEPWLRKRWCIGRITGEYLAQMEDILDLYEEACDPRYPCLCMDERPCQLIDDVLAPIPMKPGKPTKADDEYERKGTCSIFIICEPLTGWRYVEVRKQSTKVDYAEFMDKVSGMYLDMHLETEKIRVVQDNLNTHTYGSFYENFDPEKARSLKNLYEFHM